MLSPRYRHLTRSYVEALGLHAHAGHRRIISAVFVFEGAIKPVTHCMWERCVMFEGSWYFESPDGLSFDLRDAG